jgi:hypothetical protein
MLQIYFSLNLNSSRKTCLLLADNQKDFTDTKRLNLRQLGPPASGTTA